MVQFKVGDRVACPSWYAREVCYGTICEAGGGSVGVSLDIYSAHRHTCAGHCAIGHGWYFSASDLKLVTPAPIKTKKDLVIEKIKYLDEKFKNRKSVNTAIDNELSFLDEEEELYGEDDEPVSIESW